MSVHVSAWVWRHSRSKAGTRLVVLALADFASEDGYGSWPSVGTLADRCNCSERAVQYALRWLEREGEIELTGRSGKGTNVYRVIMADGGVQDLHPVQPIAPDLPVVRETSTSVTHTGGVQGGMMRAPARVDRKPVTDREALLASQVLGAWNRSTGQSLRASATLGKIVMRLREYPDLGLAEHEHIIEVSLARPWWRGTPSPSVIYGNDAQFERQLAEASRSAHSEVQSAFDVAMRVLNERSST